MTEKRRHLDHAFSISVYSEEIKDGEKCSGTEEYYVHKTCA
jgi:hypothetical protein